MSKIRFFVSIAITTASSPSKLFCGHFSCKVLLPLLACDMFEFAIYIVVLVRLSHRCKFCQFMQSLCHTNSYIDLKNVLTFLLTIPITDPLNHYEDAINAVFINS